MINPYMILAGIMGVVGSFGAGFMVGKEFETGQCDGRLIAEMRLASTVYDKKVSDLDQCQAEVSKFNRSVSAQKDEIAALRRSQDAAREEAQAEARDREVKAERSREALRNVLLQLRDTINDEDFGQCAGESVPDNYISLLNNAIDRTAGGDVSGSEGGMSASDSGD